MAFILNVVDTEHHQAVDDPAVSSWKFHSSPSTGSWNVLEQADKWTIRHGQKSIISFGLWRCNLPLEASAPLNSFLTHVVFALVRSAELTQCCWVGGSALQLSSMTFDFFFVNTAHYRHIHSHHVYFSNKSLWFGIVQRPLNALDVLTDGKKRCLNNCILHSAMSSAHSFQLFPLCVVNFQVFSIWTAVSSAVSSLLRCLQWLERPKLFVQTRKHVHTLLELHRCFFKRENKQEWAMPAHLNIVPPLHSSKIWHFSNIYIYLIYTTDH